MQWFNVESGLLAKRSLEHDALASALDRARPLEAGERSVEGFTGKAQFTRDILKLTSWGYRVTIRSGVEIKVQRHPLLGGANLHQLDLLPKRDDLMRHKRQERHGACRPCAKGSENCRLGIDADP